MEEKQILYNALETPDGTIIESQYRHDYQTYVDKNGKEYMIDGGKDYVRCSANGDEKMLTICDDGTHEVRRTFLKWGNNYTKEGNKLPKTVFIRIKDLATDHIQAILDTQHHLPNIYKETFEEELRLRYNKE